MAGSETGGERGFSYEQYKLEKPEATVEEYTVALGGYRKNLIQEQVAGPRILRDTSPVSPAQATLAEMPLPLVDVSVVPQVAV